MKLGCLSAKIINDRQLYGSVIIFLDRRCKLSTITYLFFDETYFWRVKMLVDSPMALMRRARSEGMLVEVYWA